MQESGRGHPGFLALIEEVKSLHIKKALDYGRGEDPLANLRGSAEVGVEPWRATVVRLMDKVHRLKSFMLNGRLENEGVEDTLLDMAAYALLALALYREAQALERKEPS